VKAADAAGDPIDLDDLKKRVSDQEKRRRTGRLQTIIGVITRSVEVPADRVDQLRNALSQQPLIQRAIESGQK